MTRALLALATWTCLSSASSAATWDQSPRDPFVDRSGSGEVGKLSSGEVGVVLPSWGRTALYLCFRSLTLEPKALAAGNDSAKSLRQARGASDRRAGAIEAWAAERGIDLKTTPGWSPWGVSRPFASDVLGVYVNCAPDAFRLGLATLADLRGRKDVSKQDVADWLTAQDAVFGFCGFLGLPASSGNVAAAGLPTVPAPLPAKVPPLLRQLRSYQVASAHFYGRSHDKALGAFDAIAKSPGHVMRGWAAIGALRTVLRAVTLDLEWLAVEAAAQAPGVVQADAAKRLSKARQRNRQTRAKAFGEIRTRVSAILANKDLAPVHDVARSTMDEAQRRLVPREWWGQGASRLAQLELHPDLDDGTLFSWADSVGEQLDESPEPELGVLRAKYPFVDWIATIQACTDNPASPHAKGRCDEEHAHALAAWSKAPTRAWLVAALATARVPAATDEPLLRAAAEVPEEAPEAQSARYHAARLLAAAGRLDQAALLVDAALRVVRSGSSGWHLLQQLRLVLATKLEEIGPLVSRDSSSSRVALGADGRRLLNQVLASEDLLRLADAPATPRPLAAELYLAAWFRADLVGKPRVAEAAARRVQVASPNLAGAVGYYLAAAPEKRHTSLLLTATSYAISPQVGWHRTARRGAWWCSFEPTWSASQEAIQRATQAPTLGGLAAATEEQRSLRALGPGSSYQVQELLKLVAAPSFPRAQIRKLLEGAKRDLESDDCSNADATRLTGELDLALAALK